MTDPGVTVGGVHYNVTAGEVATRAQDVDSTAGDIREKLDRLKAYVVTLESENHGVAMNEFNILMHDWDIYASMLHDALVDIASGLRGTYVNYYDSEAQNINNLRKLHEDIPAPPTGTNFD